MFENFERKPKKVRAKQFFAEDYEKHWSKIVRVLENWEVTDETRNIYYKGYFLTGNTSLNEGDWVTVDHKNNFAVIKNNEFKEDYERV